jgi:LysM repeat protein
MHLCNQQNMKSIMYLICYILIVIRNIIFAYVSRYAVVLFGLFICPNEMIAQYHTQLGNALGLDMNSEELLVNSSNELADVLNDIGGEEYLDSFKIYSSSYYINKNSYDEVEYFQERIRQQIDKKYFILFECQIDQNNNIKYSISFNLPLFTTVPCLTQMKYDILLKDISEISNLYKDFVEFEIFSIDSCRSFISKYYDCCDESRNFQCDNCMEDSKIRKYIESLGFLGFEIEFDGNQANYISGAVKNYSSKKVNNININSLAEDVIASYKDWVNESGYIYITDDTHACETNDTFELVKNLIFNNTNDADLWIHLVIDDEDDNKGYLYIFSEFYFTADNNVGDEVLLFNNTENRNNLPNFLLINPVNYRMEVSDNASMWDFEYAGNSDDYDYPIHVVSENESLSSICSQYGGEFTTANLIEWNDLQSTNLSIGQQLKIFVDEVDFMNRAEIEYCPLIVSIDPSLQSYNLNNTGSYFELRGLNGLVLKPNYKWPEGHMQGGPTSPKQPGENPKTITDETPEPRKLHDFVRILMRSNLILYFIFMPANINQPIPGTRLDAMLEFNEKPIVQSKSDDEYESEFKYVTYTKNKLSEQLILNKQPNFLADHGKVYVGRSQGFSHPNVIVKTRDRNHHKVDYSNACLDLWAISNLGKGNKDSDPAYKFIRGREQNVMDIMGKPLSMMKFYEDLENGIFASKLSRSGNAINGISPNSYNYLLYKGYASVLTPAFWEPNDIHWNGRFCE